MNVLSRCILYLLGIIWRHAVVLCLTCLPEQGAGEGCNADTRDIRQVTKSLIARVLYEELASDSLMYDSLYATSLNKLLCLIQGHIYTGY